MDDGRPLTHEELVSWMDGYLVAIPPEAHAAVRAVVLGKIPGVMMNAARRKMARDVAAAVLEPVRLLRVFRREYGREVWSSTAHGLERDSEIRRLRREIADLREEVCSLQGQLLETEMGSDL